MGKLAGWLTNYFLQCNIIRKEQVEWCQYVLCKKMTSAFVYTLLIFLGSLIAGFLPAFLFTSALFFLRKRTNGYHARTELGCVSMSVSFEIIAMWLLPHFVFESYIILLGGSLICVLPLAPVNNSQIHLSDSELNAMRWRSYLRILILVIGSVVLWGCGFQLAAVSLALALFFSAISLALAALGFGIQ